MTRSLEEICRVVYQMKLKKLTQRRIAAESEMSLSTVNMTIHGKKNNPKVINTLKKHGIKIA